MILTGVNRRTRRKTCPSATLSTTNAAWTNAGVKSGLWVERAVTNRLSLALPVHKLVFNIPADVLHMHDLVLNLLFGFIRTDREFVNLDHVFHRNMRSGG
jgi:hypothetical protein